MSCRKWCRRDKITASSLIVTAFPGEKRKGGGGGDEGERGGDEGEGREK